MKAIVAGLTDNIEYNENGTGQSYGQSRNIDRIESFVLADAPYGNSNEISPHDSLIFHFSYS
jgi:hypothetical protein